MNRTKVKNYAPQARRDFIQAVTDRAAFYGLTAQKVEPITESGDLAIIGGRAFPRSVVSKRKRLEERIKRESFEQTMEAMAYTWFNRFAAIRYMELHGYLDHGYRVLSHPNREKTIPEIVEHAEHVDLAGLDKNKVIELKLDGTKEADLYRLLLIAQCNALHFAIPFLFDPIDHETELLLPDNLLHSDSVIRKMINEIDEDDWQEVEIIGWLYESYISERYQQIIGKVVKSEDIPAATQRFTPKWIVRYLVQNTLGRMWLATYPNSNLRTQMKYYIEPAEQPPEVQEQLKAVTPKTLNPEELTLLDSATGSGHILVEGYDLFKAIYQECGYRARDIPQLILTKNLFGLEIDDRAAQLAGFALLMKARADDPSLFQSEPRVRPNVLSVQDTKAFNAHQLTKALNEPVQTHSAFTGELFEREDELFTMKNMAISGDLAEVDIAELINLFQDAKTLGSLIRVPPGLASKLPAIEERLRLVSSFGEGFNRQYAVNLLHIVEQAKLLARQYDCVVTNPPYMAIKSYTTRLQKYVSENYKDANVDLYACFLQRNASFANSEGLIGMITIPNWMFLSSFQDFRLWVLSQLTILTFIHNGRGVWGSDFGSCSFVMSNSCINGYVSTFKRLFDKQGSVASNEELIDRYFNSLNCELSQSEFAMIPGQPLAYWLSPAFRKVFTTSSLLCTMAELKQGMSTTDSDRFVRFWFEVAIDRIDLGRKPGEPGHDSRCWYPFNKGGGFRKWYGNYEYIVRYERDGEFLLALVRDKYPRISDPEFVIKNRKHYFKEAITYTSVSSSYFGVRYLPQGFIFSVAGPVILVSPGMVKVVLAFLCSKLAALFVNAINPSLGFQGVDIGRLPLAEDALETHKGDISLLVEDLIAESKTDWDSSELSWDFSRFRFLSQEVWSPLIQNTYRQWVQDQNNRIARVRNAEEKLNRIFVDAYELGSELSPDITDDNITLYRPDPVEDTKRLISYAIGCMMGRYSLDRDGLIYAHHNNKGFDVRQYAKFPADQDGIIPITEIEWFPNDATNRVVEFISVAWPKEHLEQNLRFIAENLGSKRAEAHRDSIRRYVATGFYKHHLSIYKRRPIYWLFSSGKEAAFQCLVYLHRYHEGTLARMRTEYVIPLQGKMAARIDQLTDAVSKAKSTSDRKKFETERGGLVRHLTELRAFDEKLRHYADQRITLDLDDGVKVNYGKFGDLLAEVKTVCGKSGEDE